jgi:hypothetical protein
MIRAQYGMCVRLFLCAYKAEREGNCQLSADTFVHDSTRVKENRSSSVGSVAQLLSRAVGENGHSAQPLPRVRITLHHWLVSNVTASPALSPPSCGRNQ